MVTEVTAVEVLRSTPCVAATVAAAFPFPVVKSLSMMLSFNAVESKEFIDAISISVVIAVVVLFVGVVVVVVLVVIVVPVVVVVVVVVEGAAGTAAPPSVPTATGISSSLTALSVV